MIRIIVDRPYENGKRFIKAAGLSTDNKPTDGIITGSRFLEVDYGIEKIFDEENGVWNFFQGAVDIQSFTATANATNAAWNTNPCTSSTDSAPPRSRTHPTNSR